MPKCNITSLTLSLGILIALSGLAACEKHQFSWMEDVRLSDGTTVTVERYMRYAHITHEMGGPTSYWVGISKVAIVKGSTRYAEWAHQLEPIVLDRDPKTGLFLLIASGIDYCKYASRFGPPNPTYVAFRLEPNGWQHVALPLSMIGRDANLLIGVPDSDSRGHVTPAMTASLNWSDFPDQHYRTVSKELLDNCAKPGNFSLSRY